MAHCLINSENFCVVKIKGQKCGSWARKSFSLRSTFSQNSVALIFFNSYHNFLLNYIIFGYLDSFTFTYVRRYRSRLIGAYLGSML